jgi:AbrB family looped-hinge helix DNA binding protein
MKELNATFTSKGQLVVPAALRRKHGIEAGTRVRFVEDQFGRIVLQPITEQYVDRVMGCLAGEHGLLESWEKEHHEEGERDK